MAINPPIVYPTSIPNHTPFIPQSNTIPKSTAKTVAHIASRIIVKASECVPLPSPWNTYVEMIPPGNTIKNHANMWKNSIVGSKSLELAPYEICMLFVVQRLKRLRVPPLQAAFLFSWHNHMQLSCF